MNRPLASAVVALALGLALLSSPRTASAISLSPDADAWVQRGNATTNNGTSTQLVIKDSGSGTTTRKGYVRFDLSGLFLPHLQAASFDLVVDTRNDGGQAQQSYTIQIYGLNDGHAGEFWVEGNGGTDNNPTGEITWNNAPANDTANNNFIAAQATLLGSFVVPGTANPGDLFTFSNAALENFLKADTNGAATLLIRRTGGQGANNLAFASDESTVRVGPRLNLTIVPEPATGLLGLLGLAAMGRRRRAA